jgi:hypothetical protein
MQDVVWEFSPANLSIARETYTIAYTNIDCRIFNCKIAFLCSYFAYVGCVPSITLQSNALSVRSRERRRDRNQSHLDK